MPEHYVRMLQALYHEQRAIVRTTVESSEFPIGRAVKQGDPISALLFIAVMQDCLGDLCPKLGKAHARRTGTTFGVPFSQCTDTLPNLRFADDVILFVQSLADIKKMLKDFATYSAKYGSRINFAKTKVMARASVNHGASSITIGDKSVSILHEDAAEKYLGRKLCVSATFHEVECRNRLAAG